MDSANVWRWHGSTAPGAKVTSPVVRFRAWLCAPTRQSSFTPGATSSCGPLPRAFMTSLRSGRMSGGAHRSGRSPAREVTLFSRVKLARSWRSRPCEASTLCKLRNSSPASSPSPSIRKPCSRRWVRLASSVAMTPQCLPAARSTPVAFAMRSPTPGPSHLPGYPAVEDRSAGPKKKRSAPFTFASCSMFCTPLTDSMIGTTSTLASASAVCSTKHWPQHVARSAPMPRIPRGG